MKAMSAPAGAAVHEACLSFMDEGWLAQSSGALTRPSALNMCLIPRTA